MAATSTWFEKSKLGPHIIMSICYSYALNESYDQCRREAVEIDENGVLNTILLSQVSKYFQIHKLILKISKF